MKNEMRLLRIMPKRMLMSSEAKPQARPHAYRISSTALASVASSPSTAMAKPPLKMTVAESIIICSSAFFCSHMSRSASAFELTMPLTTSWRWCSTSRE